MSFDPTIKLGLAARAAPMLGAELAYKENDEWISGVRAKTPEVGSFVRGTIERFWYRDLMKILEAQRWGWAAAEVLYKVSTDGQVVYDRILHRHSADVQALTRTKGGGRVEGVRFQKAGPNNADVDLQMPRAIWHAFDPQAESAYGWPVLLGAYSPWADKWFEGGGLEVRRLFMRKDAYRGGRIFYPPGTINIDGKGDVPNRDVAREIIEQMLSGAVETYPSVYDANGNRMWEPIDARVASNPTHILEHPKDLDTEILRGIEVPDDILKSDQSGAWQGKQVPMMAFYSGLNRWLVVLLENFVQQIVEPLVFMNWGRAEEFSARMKPLELQMFERMKGTDGDGNGGGQAPPPPQQPGQAPQQPPRRLSLDLAVGRGEVSAYEAARRFWDNG